jgi:hypothetical protein
MEQRMKLFIEGDKFKAICSHCKDWVDTTFKYRDVSFSNGSGVVKDILVAVCDSCGQVVATPPQSTPKIKKSRAKALKSVEVSVPATLDDAVNVAMHAIDVDFSQEFKKKALWLFVRTYANGPKDPIGLKAEYAAKIGAFGKVKSRFSFKVSEAMLVDLKKASETFGENQTETLKIAAFDLYNKVIEQKDKRLIAKLRDIAYMA